MGPLLSAIGLIFMGLGLWQGWEALAYSPTDISGQTANLIAISNREVTIIAAAAGVIAGAVLIGFGVLFCRDTSPPSGSV